MSARLSRAACFRLDGSYLILDDDVCECVLAFWKFSSHLIHIASVGIPLRARLSHICNVTV